METALFVQKEMHGITHHAHLTLRTARRLFTCRCCRHTIGNGEQYYSIFYSGSGLRGMKFPDRIHVECLETWKGR